MSNIPIIKVGDTLELKKSHPCGCNLFKVARVGSDIKIVCNGCARALVLERIKLEKMIKHIIMDGNNDEQ